MVNFSSNNLAKRNEKQKKIRLENNKVLRDLKLSGLAKMLTSEILKGIFEGFTDEISSNKIKDYHMFKFEDVCTREKFESKVKEEFRVLGFKLEMRNSNSDSLATIFNVTLLE